MYPTNFSRGLIAPPGYGPTLRPLVSQAGYGPGAW